MSQALALTPPIGLSTPRLSTVERWILAIVMLELPIQIDTYLFYMIEPPSYGAIGGLNVSILTGCLALLYLIRLPEFLVVQPSERGSMWKLSWPLTMYMAAVCFSIVGSYDRTLTFFYIAMILQSYLLYLYLVRFVRTRESILFTAAMLLLGAAIESAIMIALWFYNESIELPFVNFLIDTQDGSRVSGTVGSPVAAASYLSPLLAPALALMISPVRPVYRCIAAATLALGTVGLTTTLSRGGLITFGISVAIVCLLCWFRGWISAILPVVLGLMVSTVVLLNAATLTERVFGDDNGSAAVRFTQYRMGLQMVADHPLLGIGANNCASIGLNYANSPEFRGEWYYTIHNRYLLDLVEYGIFGFLAMLTFLAVTLRRGWQGWQFRDRMISPLALGLTAALASQMIHMFVDIFNSRVQVQTIWVVAALITAIRFHTDEGTDAE